MTLELPNTVERVVGLILGTALGDALGLPFEGLKARQVQRLLQRRRERGFVFRRLMVSDDTDHTIFVASALLRHPDSADSFVRDFAWSLRWWLLTIPVGIGGATLRSICRLWCGYSPQQSGVYSAGNGPAMRAAIVGAFFCRDDDQAEQYLKVMTTLSHLDPRALIGARAVSRVAAWILRDRPTERPQFAEFRDILLSAGSDNREWVETVELMERLSADSSSVSDLAIAMGLGAGVSGYVFHTVPVAIYSWWRNFRDFDKTVWDVIECGGDTDTVAAIAGALAGAVVGENGLPSRDLLRIWDWPRGIVRIRRIGNMLACLMELPPTEQARDRIRIGANYLWWLYPIRSLVMIVAVYLHLLGRLGATIISRF